MTASGKASLEALRAEVEALRAALSAPRPEPARPPEIDSQRLMEEVRARLAARRLAVPELEFSSAEAIALLATPPAPLAYRDEYALHELLAFHDEDFVRNAYRALLHREADAGGLAEHLALLRRGAFAKVEILSQIAGSPEARQVKVKVRGLRMPSFVRMLRRVPVLGRLVGIAVYVVQLPLVVRNIEQQETLLFQRERELRAAIDAASRRNTRVETGITTLVDLVGRLDREKAPRSIEASLAERIWQLREAVDELAAETAHSPSREELMRIAQAALDAAYESDARTDQLAAHLESQLERRNLEDILLRGGHDLDAFYVAFEDAFRGSREDIKGRVSVYLPYVRAAGAGTAQAPVLDLGCGRGEWLEVLKENGLVAYGLDLNRQMVDHGRARGLEIVEGDVVDHLNACAPGTLGAITAMHLVEHISFERLLDLFAAALRALRPGGIAIFETPNPENLITGACNFWYDPTHLKPLPPPAAQFIVQSRGFERVEILRLHPNEDDRLRDIPDPWLKGLLLGPQDYAIMAYKQG